MKTPAQEIDAIIEEEGGWKGEMLSKLRAVIKKADPDIVEEVKWKKPSNPGGVGVWSHGGIICVENRLKSAVRLTFPNGPQIKDLKGLFNTRLDSKAVRAIDFFENDRIDEAGLRALILEAVRLKERKGPVAKAK